MGELGTPVDGMRHLLNVKVHILYFSAALAMDSIKVFCYPDSESIPGVFCIRSVADNEVPCTAPKGTGILRVCVHLYACVTPTRVAVNYVSAASPGCLERAITAV